MACLWIGVRAFRLSTPVGRGIGLTLGVLAVLWGAGALGALTHPTLPALAGLTATALATGALVLWSHPRLVEPRLHRALFDHIPSPALGLDARGRIVAANRAAQALCSRAGTGLLGLPVDRALADWPTLARVLSAPGPTARSAHSIGEREWALEVLDVGAAGRIAHLTDITPRNREEVLRRDREALLAGVLETSPNGILVLRPQRNPRGAVVDFLCVFANPGAERHLGSPAGPLTGRTLRQFLPSRAGELIPFLADAVFVNLPTETQLGIGNGSRERWFRVIALRVGEDVSTTLVDITDQRRREVEMEEAAHRDPLTGVLNRRGFENQARLWFPGPDRRAPGAALLYCDLDGFKPVNDQYGHQAGDRLLMAFARRLRGAVRAPDRVARLGGDEFALVLPNADGTTAQEVAERIVLEAGRPYHVDAQLLRCEVSIGIAVYPDDGDDLETLLVVADRRMYEAKQQPRSSSRNPSADRRSAPAASFDPHS